MCSSPKQQSYSKHIASPRLLQHGFAAVGHEEPQDMQYQVRNKGKETKMKMQALIWVVQPAHLCSSRKECSEGHLSVWLTFLLPFCPQNPIISQYNCFYSRDLTQDLALPAGFSHSSICTPVALKWVLFSLQIWDTGTDPHHEKAV